MIVQQGPLSIRKLTEQDVPLMVKWLTDERVLAFYEGRDRPQDKSMVRAHYLGRTDSATGCIVSWAGCDIGYLQYYPVADAEKQAYGYTDDESVYGMDQFIGEPAYWNQGIGTAMVKAVVDYLTGARGIHRVVMDPQACNERALRCYEKCGFRKVKRLPKHEYHEGQMRDCWLIEYEQTP